MSFIDKTYTINKSFALVGEELKFSTEIPIRYWSRLDDIVIQTTGTNINRTLSVKFRYTHNGIVYNDWKNVDDILSISIDKKDDFLVEIWFERTGVQDNTSIVLHSITLEGEFDNSYISVFNFLKGTVFEDISPEDETWNKLWINLLKKLYEKGIVPEYITRDQGEEELNTDEDYITFWKTVAYFYAYLSETSRRKVGGLRDDDNYLKEYLEQKGVFLFPNGDHREENIHVLENIFDEFRQRGTLQVVTKKSDTKPTYGEMLRMIGYEDQDEFLFEYLPRHLSGWCINRTSPIYRGKTSNKQLNKAPEHTEDIVDLSKYVLTNSSGVSIVTSGTKKVARLINASMSYSVRVDPYISYEFTFWFKMKSNTPMLKVAAEATYNGDVETPLQRISSTANESTILNNVQMPNGDVFYFARCIVYAKGNSLSGDSARTNLGVGEHLKMVSSETNEIKIKIQNTHSTEPLLIWDIKCKPLNLTKSSVYINSYNVMTVFLNNRNASLTVIDFEEKVRRYLVPYGTIFQLFASPKSEFTPETILVQNDGFDILSNNNDSILV